MGSKGLTVKRSRFENVGRDPRTLALGLTDDVPHVGDARRAAEAIHVDLVDGDRPLLAGFDDPAHQTVTVERLTAAVLLDNHERYLLDIFIRRESLLTFQTFAPPADGGPFRVQTRINDLCFLITARRTVHGLSVL